MDFQRNQTFSQYLISKNISVEFILEQIDILEKLVEDEPHFSFYWKRSFDNQSNYIFTNLRNHVLNMINCPSEHLRIFVC